MNRECAYGPNFVLYQTRYFEHRVSEVEDHRNKLINRSPTRAVNSNLSLSELSHIRFQSAESERKNN